MNKSAGWAVIKSCIILGFLKLSSTIQTPGSWLKLNLKIRHHLSHHTQPSSSMKGTSHFLHMIQLLFFSSIAFCMSERIKLLMKWLFLPTFPSRYWAHCMSIVMVIAIFITNPKPSPLIESYYYANKKGMQNGKSTKTPRPAVQVGGVWPPNA